MGIGKRRRHQSCCWVGLSLPQKTNFGMKTKELYDHITKHMTPEHALMKLLQSSLLTYHHLKFPAGDGKEVHPEILISMAAFDLGWMIAVEAPDGDKTRDLIGLSVGTEEYLKQLFQSKEQNEAMNNFKQSVVDFFIGAAEDYHLWDEQEQKKPYPVERSLEAMTNFMKRHNLTWN